ncbi:MAG: glycosyltransferase [Gemmatimonadetes bacterium]|nr:glycosyltransferase [Gemmatimonadota bacterium]
MKVTVSVVLASYNQASYLREAVESVLAQTLADWELVVVDNGSTDGSHEILREYADDPRIRLVLHDRNEAITRRLNEAISLTRGEFVSLLYSDDFYLPEKLERQVACFATLPEKVGVVHGPGYRLNQLTGARWFVDAVRTGEDTLRDCVLGLRQGFINPIAPLFRRKCWERYPFNEQVFVEGEHVYWRYALSFDFFYLDEPLVVMRDHESNIGKATRANLERLMGLMDRLGADPEFPASHQPHLRFARADLLCRQGWETVRLTDDTSLARSYFRRSLQVRWRQALQPRMIAGVGLSLLPRSVRGRLNRSANRVISHPGNQIVLDEAPGRTAAAGG